MKTFFISFLLLYGVSSSAQKFYDFQDTRKKNESFAKLPKTEIRADLATFTLSGIDEAVGKDELQKIPFTTFGSDFMNFEGDNIKASVKLLPFDKSKHKLDYDEKYLIRITGKLTTAIMEICQQPILAILQLPQAMIVLLYLPRLMQTFTTLT